MNKLLALMATLLVSNSAYSATYQVTSNAATGNGTLRWAIEQANQNPGPDIVEIPATFGNNAPIYPGLAGAGVSSNPIIIEDDVIIRGLGNDRVVIDDKQRWITSGGLLNAGYPFDAGVTILKPSSLLFRVNPRNVAGRVIDVTIENIAVTHTGSVLNADDANVTLNNVALFNNVVQDSSYNLILHGSSDLSGPNVGSLTINDSLIFENRVNNGKELILAFDTDLIISNTAIADNSTGQKAISSSRVLSHVSLQQSTATIKDSYFAGFRDAAFSFKRADVEIANSLFDGRNSLATRSLLVDDGDLTLTNSTLYFTPKTAGGFPPLFNATHIDLLGSAQLIANNNLIFSTDPEKNTLPLISPTNWADTTIYPRAVNKNNYLSTNGVADTALNLNALGCFNRNRCFVPNELSLPLVDMGNDEAAKYSDGTSIASDYLKEVRPQGAAIDIGAYEKHESLYPHNDSYTTEEGVSVLKNSAEGVLANDTTPGGLDATLTKDVLHGSLTLEVDGSFLYTPNDGYYGHDSFEYDLGGKTATVNIDIQSTNWISIPTNSRPTTQQDTYSLHTTEVLTIHGPGVLANDRDDQNSSEPFYQGLTSRLFSDVSNGQLQFNSDGSFTYTPEADFVGIDEFYYDAVDLNLAHSFPQRVTLQVKAGEPLITETDEDSSGQAIVGGSVGYSGLIVLLLLIYRRLTLVRRGLLAVALSSVALSTNASTIDNNSEDKGFFVNADLGMSYLSPDLDDTQWKQDDKYQPAFGIGFGYQFDSNWSTYVSYNWLNEAKLESDAVGYPNTDVQYHLFRVNAKYRINQLWGDNFAPFVVLGISYIEPSIDGASELIDIDENTHFNYGIGINLNRNDYGKIDLLWEKVSDDVQIVSAQFVFDLPL
ncbi:Ig-like domain-containing protein [Vibrio comitans]|uniref:Ig-like domain-containing protein n=2 Tax=Vibrio comitans TaxID=413401 RepID=UPI003081AFD1